MEHSAIIHALGGPAKLAADLGCDRTRPIRWANEGIPPARFPQITALAAKAGRADITADALFAGRAVIGGCKAEAA